MPRSNRAARELASCFTLGVTLFAASLPASCAWAGAPLPATPDAWRLAATTDIDAAVRLTRENHPGMHDPRNPGFVAKLEAAHEHALALASRVNGPMGYMAALEGFNMRLGDGHAGVFSTMEGVALPAARWPGFVTVWRGDALYVYATQDGQPAAGSKLLACDGKPAVQLIKENVFSFKGRVAEPGQWWLARNLFIDWHNPFIQLPQRCSFEANGKVAAHALVWRSMDDEGERWRAESRDGGTHPVGITEPRKNLFWVSMPTFQPDEGERAAYRAINREIDTQRARYLGADAVVIDLRKNQGGSSLWSTDFASALWGKERVARARAAYSAKTDIWWRASPGNTGYVVDMADTLAREGHPETAARTNITAEGMRGALARGEPFYVEKKSPPDAPGKADDTADEVAPFSRPVYVIVPGNCVSSCLNAVDIFTRFPNTTLVGAPSSADSTYMEVRQQDLPSGLSKVILPTKVYVNRPRGNGQVYHPKLPVLDVAWSTQTLLKVVEGDLARH